MADYTVTVVDTTQIQAYVFGSNRLQENIGASELVRRATGQWALDAVREVVKDKSRHNVLPETPQQQDNRRLRADFRLEADAQNAAEVLYVGGGNLVALFAAPELACKFAQTLTTRVLQDAPGLSLVVAHNHGLFWSKNAVAAVLRHLLGRKLSELKAARAPSAPLLGLSVTAACQSTGLPAATTTEGRFPGSQTKISLGQEETRLISREILQKLAARDWANDRLHDLFAAQLGSWYGFPSDVDKLGRIKGEESYVAVVHADGNGMGQRISKLAEKYGTAAQNRDYIKAMRGFSQAVSDAATAALRDLVRWLTVEQKNELVGGAIPLARECAWRNGATPLGLPFRPLVFGGDDVTFLCHGQLGLRLAAKYLEAFEKETQKRVPECEFLADLHACAGVALVKMHYPFARAYRLSEDLMKEAKKYVKKDVQQDASALDWHIANSGISGSLGNIRHREYMNGALVLRPVLLRRAAHQQDGRAWLDGVRLSLREFALGADWRDKRNKVKALREVLRDEQEVRKFCTAYGLPKLPEAVPAANTYRESGWQGGRCGYFDAIELLDHYLWLDGEKEEAGL